MLYFCVIIVIPVQERTAMAISLGRFAILLVLLAPLAGGCGQPAALGEKVEASASGDPFPASEDVVRGYLEAKTWQERLPYVLDPERIRPLLEERYGGRATLSPPKSFSISPPVERGAYLLMNVSGSDADGQAFQSLLPLKRTGVGGKIDWEAAVGYNPKSLKTFLATKTNEPAVFRVMCDRASYYTFNYVNARHSHLSVRIVDADPFKTTHGYISRDSDVGERLVELLEDGKAHPLTLELKCEGPEGEPITRPDANAVAIMQIISESWVVGEKPAPAPAP
jgi:hypothetical protein